MSHIYPVLVSALFVFACAAITVYASVKRLFPLATWAGSATQLCLGIEFLIRGERWLTYLLFATALLGVASAVFQHTRLQRSQ